MTELNKTIDDKKYTPVEICSVNELASRDPERLVAASERYYNDQVMRAAQIIRRDANYRFVLLCGPSASGKTTTAYKLKKRLIEIGAGARVVSMDNFFMGIEAYPKLPNGKPDMESILTLDLDLLNESFDKLLQTGETKLPTFDFVAQRRSFEQHHVKLEPGDVLIMEGIHALNPQVLKRIPRENVFRMYVSVRSKFVENGEKIMVPKDIRLTRRIVRDHKFRGWPPESTLEQWEHVLEGERENINPYRDDVDFKMDNTIDYEVCVWHQLLNELLKNREKYKAYPDIDRLFESLMRFQELDYKLIPEDSLLREFIGAE